MRGRLIVLLFTLAWLVPPSAQSGDAIAELEPIVVSGVQPGPGLWKVSRGGHVLWVLCVLSPVPRRELNTFQISGR